MSVNVLTMGGGGGEKATINVTGTAQTDTVTCTKGGKSYKGQWVSVPNPEAHGLPAGYTELEYIESTGSQYIDTGVMNSDDNTVEIKFEHIKPDNNDCLIGVRRTGYATNAALIRSASNVTRAFKSNKLCDIVIKNGSHTLKLTPSYVVYDGSTISWSEDSGNDRYGQLTIFCGYYGNTMQYGVYRLNGLIILNGSNVILRDYIPCKRQSDSAIGLYDLVTNTFFDNSGTGTFVAGPEVPQIVDCWQFKVDEYGEYTITANNGTVTYTKTVLVDAAVEFTVEIMYSLWLYKDGDECIDITGGWVNPSINWTSNGSYQWKIFDGYHSSYTTITRQKKSDQLYLAIQRRAFGDETCGTASFYTSQAVDLTPYSKLKLLYDATQTIYGTGSYGSGGMICLFPQDVNPDGASYESGVRGANMLPQASTTNAIAEFDIAQFNGNYFVVFGKPLYTRHNEIFSARQIWLE